MGIASLTPFYFAKILFFGLLLCLNSCAFRQTAAFCEEKHFLYSVIPENKEQIPPWAVGTIFLWSFFGNDDGGLFGEKEPVPYLPEYPNDFGKAVKWFIRNPFHNFCFYVIGSADRENSSYTLFALSDEGVKAFKYNQRKKIYAGKNFGLFFALHGGKPFLSLQLRYLQKRGLRLYIGWRERGNFGLKFSPFCQI